MSTKIRQSYDWIVIGDHPGALLSGCMAARLGMSVLMIPLIPSRDRIIHSRGIALDPESNFILGLGKLDRSSGLVQIALSQFNLNPSEEEMFIHRDPLPQILTPQSRVNIAFDNEGFFKELKREFGEALYQELGLDEALSHSEFSSLHYWHRLPYRLSISQLKSKKRKNEDPGSFEEWRLKLERTLRSRKKLTRQWFSQEKTISQFVNDIKCADLEKKAALKQTLVGISESLSDGQELKLSEWIHLLGLSRVGGSVYGGLTIYRELLKRIARRLGATVADDVETHRIFMERGKFVGVQVANQGLMTSARGAVLGCGVAHAEGRFSEAGLNLIYRKKTPPTPIGWKFTLAVLVKAQGVTPGFSRRMCWSEEGSPLVEIEVVDSKEYFIEHDDQKLVFLRTLLPYHSDSLQINYQKEVAKKLYKLLTEILPFIENHTLDMYPDFNQEDEFSEVYGYPVETLIPENLKVYSSNQGIGSRSGYEGLFVASNESYPEYGSLGPNIAAMEAVAWLAHRSGLEGPLGAQ